jgi:hypothetical protein
LARQRPRLYAAHLSRTVIALAAGGALCVGLATIGAPSAARVAVPSAPSVATIDAVYGHSQSAGFQPAGQAAAMARAVTAAVVRWSVARWPVAQRAAATQDSVVLQSPRRTLASAMELAVQQAAAARVASVRRAAAARRAVAAAVQAAVPTGTPRAIAARLLDADGWARQFSCLDALWERESGWNVYAENPSSGAYGIPQALYASEMSSAGPDWRSNAETQIKWGLSYIATRYGSPCAAWGHEVAAGWY